MKAKLLFIISALAPLAACAATPTAQQRAARAARVEAAAGAPVNHIQLLFRGLYGWEMINDHQVVAYVTPKKAYLLDLPPCPGIDHSPAIAISSRMSQISVNFDAITPGNTGVPCRIRQIRPLDMSKLKAAMDTSNKNVQIKPRPSGHPGTTGS